MRHTNTQKTKTCRNLIDAPGNGSTKCEAYETNGRSTSPSARTSGQRGRDHEASPFFPSYQAMRSTDEYTDARNRSSSRPPARRGAASDMSYTTVRHSPTPDSGGWFRIDLISIQVDEIDLKLIRLFENFWAYYICIFCVAVVLTSSVNIAFSDWVEKSFLSRPFNHSMARRDDRYRRLRL